MQMRVATMKVGNLGLLIGSIILWGISFTLWSIPARCFVALSINAALGPRRSLFLQ